MFSEKFVPSVMQEESLSVPKPVKIIQRSEDEISRVLIPDQIETAPVSPQRAQHAFYRSHIEQIASYNPVD
uniref:ZM domain-containing protein n=1 Tax=Heterorhabditis bacteriophora TaxID=37862 RepID=A0A1I7X9D9_HETBA